MSVDTSSEMLRNMKDVPPYDRKKHYFEQEKSTIEFYDNEIKKIKEGITINGVFIHPWLYWHLNVFVTPIPQEDKTEKIMNPVLRDNEWYFVENYMEAEGRNGGKRRGLALFGSRRFSKSTLEASVISWINTTKTNGKTEVVGGDAGDLTQLCGLIKIALSDIHPAFFLPKNKADWENEVILGLKTKDNEPIDYSHIIIKNADKGSEKSTEKGAGLSPIGYVVDEFGKFDFLPFFQGSMPSFETPFGWKVVALLAGTGGNKVLSRDAKKLLDNPEAYGIIPMNWDTLENKIEDKDLITWKRTKFGMYIPAQMSYHDDVVKEKTTLDKYLKIDGDDLSKIEIDVTNWKTSAEIIKNKRKSFGNDKTGLNKWTMYYPLDPEECFLNRIENPFPARRAEQHKKHLIKTGQTGKFVDVYANIDGIIEYDLSEKTPAPYPFEGGVHDAPVILFDEPPKIIPSRGLNVSGLDPYKQAKATTESLGSLYILRRESEILSDPMGGKILASYTSRPPIPDFFDKTCLTLIEGFGAECLMENADYGFIRYMETKNKATKWLVEGIDLAKSINPNTKSQTNYGLFPTERNKAHVIKRVLNYCNERIVVSYEEDGTPIEDLGVVRINDIYLLEEIISYKDGGNFDRIIAFGHALAWAEYLDEINVSYNPRDNNDRRKKKSRNTSGPYGKHIGMFN